MRFLAFLFLYLFIEVNISTYVGSQIGGFWMFTEIIFSILLAIFIFKNFKHSLYDTLVSLSKRTISKQKAIALNAGSLMGGILLFIPGIFSDILGLLLQISVFYTLLEKILGIEANNNNKQRKFNDEEIIDTTPTTDKHGNHVFITDQDRTENN